MLIRFSVQNFMSFDSEKMTSFSMAASKATRLKNHVIEQENHRLLRSGIIFGPNASGKSNLVHAMDFSKKIILGGCSRVNLSKKYFRLKKEDSNKPGVFQYDIIVDNNTFSYGFAVSYSKGIILSEWLYKIGTAKEECYFLREVQDDGSVKVNTDIKDNKRDKGVMRFKDNLYVFEESERMQKKMILSDIAERSSSSSKFLKQFIDVYDWFTKLMVIYPYSQYVGHGEILSEEERKIKFEKLLKFFDTGIDSVEEKVSSLETIFDNVDLDFEEKAMLRQELENDICDIKDKAMITLGDSVITLKKQDNGETQAVRMVLDHGNHEDLFECTDESDGTCRMFDLIPLLLSTELDSRVIVIDEIDRSFHSKLTLKFIELFYNLCGKTNTQLIATTHDLMLMDLELLRQDEIWFVEREKNHSSDLYSLNKFKERYDKRLQKDYLLGKYGALPKFYYDEKMDWWEDE